MHKPKLSYYKINKTPAQVFTLDVVEVQGRKNRRGTGARAPSNFSWDQSALFVKKNALLEKLMWL